MITHTPLPWVQRGNKLYIDGPAGQSIADLRFQNGTNDLPFILRACNAHYELVLAAKEAAITIKLVLDVYPNIKASDSHVLMRLMDAVAKAEGR